MRIAKIVFLFPNQNIYDVGTQKNRLNETVLLSTQPKTYVKTDGQENIYNFMLQNFVSLTLC